MENYPYIAFVPGRKTLMRRLGAQKADLSVQLEDDINSYIKKAQAIFSVRGRAEVFGIRHAAADKIILEGHEIVSPMLSRLLGGSEKVYLMCTTIPKKDVEKIHEAMGDGEGLKALVLDAYASEYVDGALDVIMDKKNMMLKRMGQKLTKRRFSAGYGDLDIRYQKVFYDLLQMQTLDVEMNEKYLLIPEKSVIAIAGVE